jgi:ATP-binding cassette subfamily B protein
MVTEAEIMEALAHLIRGRTAFIIAHRTSTLDLCDLRVEIEDGGIASIAERVA